MNKYKWLKIYLPITLSELSEKIHTNKFSTDSKKGFILSQATEKVVEGSFIEKKLSIKEMIDPFGNMTEIDIIDYIITKFKFELFDDNLILLQLKNQPRSIKPFLNTLDMITGFGVTITEFDFNLINLVNDIEKECGKINIQKMHVAEMNIDNKATAKIQVSSNDDIREVLNNEMFRKKDFLIKSIKANFINSDFEKGEFELSTNSTITLKHIPESIFIQKFKKIIVNS